MQKEKWTKFLSKTRGMWTISSPRSSRPRRSRSLFVLRQARRCAGIGAALGRCRCRRLVALDDFVNLFAMDRQFRGRLYAQLHGVLVDAEDLHDDAAVYDDAFVEFAGEDEHGVSLVTSK